MFTFPMLCVAPALLLPFCPSAHPPTKRLEKKEQERENEKQLYEGDCAASDRPGVWRQLQAPHVRRENTLQTKHTKVGMSFIVGSWGRQGRFETWLQPSPL